MPVTTNSHIVLPGDGLLDALGGGGGFTRKAQNIFPYVYESTYSKYRDANYLCIAKDTPSLPQMEKRCSFQCMTCILFVKFVLSSGEWIM